MVGLTRSFPCSLPATGLLTLITNLVPILLSHSCVAMVGSGPRCGADPNELQLSATDVSARTTMKGAAKCDKHCDLQNSVNQQGFERILRFRDIPESMPASVSTPFHATDKLHFGGLVSCACLCVRVLLALDAFSAWVVAVSTNNLKLIFDVLSLSRWWRFPLPVPSGTLPKT